MTELGNVLALRGNAPHSVFSTVGTPATPPIRLDTGGPDMAVDSVKGNALIEDQVANFLVQPLTAASVILNSPGLTVFNSSDPLRVPALNAPIATNWVGENELIPEGNAQFDELELMPTERKSIKTIVRISNELIRMAKFGVSGVLQQRVVTDVRDKLDTALLTGDGDNATVTGLINQPTVETAPLDPTDPDSILDGLAWLAANEVTPTRFYTAGADFFAMQKLKDADGRYLLTPDITQAGAYMLRGIPVTPTNKLPAGTAIMADMSQVAVVRDTDPTVTLDASRYLEFDQTAIRVTTRYDLGVLRGAAVLKFAEAA